MEQRYGSCDGLQRASGLESAGSKTIAENDRLVGEPPGDERLKQTLVCSEHPSVVEKKVDAMTATPHGNSMVLKGSWVVRVAIHDQLQKEDFMSRAKRLGTRKFAIMFCKPCLWIEVLPTIPTVCIFKFAVSLKKNKHLIGMGLRNVCLHSYVNECNDIMKTIERM